VVDDGSSDRSRAILRRWRESGRFPRFDLIERDHSGIVDSLNAALERARGDVIVRLDGDATIETPGWLERMLDFHRLDDRVGVVVAKLIFDSGRVQGFGVNVVAHEGLHDRGTRIAEPVGRRTLDTRVERPMEADAEAADEPAEVDAAIGCCTMFSRELAQAIGGWDVRYSPVWFEDFDFALSARREDRKVFYLPDVRVVHRLSLRNPRHDASRTERLLWQARRRFGHLVPSSVRERVAGAAKLGDADPKRVATLERHRRCFADKWDFDPLNPDMDAVMRRWGGTEVCWAYDPERRAAGERILDAHRRRRETVGADSS
jgi:GT2 family glycosyltransferase